MKRIIKHGLESQLIIINMDIIKSNMEFMKSINLKFKNSFLDSKGGRDPWMNTLHILDGNFLKLNGDKLEFLI